MKELFMLVVAKIWPATIPFMASIIRDVRTNLSGKRIISFKEIMFYAFAAGFMAITADDLISDNQRKGIIMFILGFAVRDILSFIMTIIQIISESYKNKIKKHFE